MAIGCVVVLHGLEHHGCESIFLGFLLHVDKAMVAIVIEFH